MGAVRLSLGRTVYLDSNIVIYAVEGFAELADQLKSILQAMIDSQIAVVTSELTVAEVLVKPLRDSNQRLRQTY